MIKQVIPSSSSACHLAVHVSVAVPSINVAVLWGIDTLSSPQIPLSSSEISKETLAVKTDPSLTRKVEIPYNIEYGTYLILGEITYGNVTASSYDTLEVEEKNAFSSIWIVFILILLILIFYTRKKYLENREYFKNILRKIKVRLLRYLGR